MKKNVSTLLMHCILIFCGMGGLLYALPKLNAENKINHYDLKKDSTKKTTKTSNTKSKKTTKTNSRKTIETALKSLKTDLSNISIEPQLTPIEYAKIKKITSKKSNFSSSNNKNKKEKKQNSNKNEETTSKKSGFVLLSNINTTEKEKFANENNKKITNKKSGFSLSNNKKEQKTNKKDENITSDKIEEKSQNNIEISDLTIKNTNSLKKSANANKEKKLFQKVIKPTEKKKHIELSTSKGNEERIKGMKVEHKKQSTQKTTNKKTTSKATVSISEKTQKNTKNTELSSQKNTLASSTIKNTNKKNTQKSSSKKHKSNSKHTSIAKNTTTSSTIQPTIKEDLEKKALYATYPRLIMENWQIRHDEVMPNAYVKIKPLEETKLLKFISYNSLEIPMGILKPLNDSIKFYGTRFNYTINGDSIFFEKNNKRLLSLKIKRLTADSLVLTKKDKSIVLIKNLFQSRPLTNDFDKIVISEFRTADFKFDKTNIILSPTQFYYYGWNISQKNNQKQYKLLTSNNPSIIFNDIKSISTGINTKSLDNFYNLNENTMDIEDLQYTISFIRNDSIIKTVQDNEYSAPKELIWFYQTARYANQIFKLNNANPAAHLNVQDLDFKQGKKYTFLKQSESFYLYSLLKDGITLNNLPNVKLLYDVVFKDETYQVTQIKSDGRYFQFVLKNGSKVWIDIKHNFLQTNNKNISFRLK